MCSTNDPEEENHQDEAQAQPDDESSSFFGLSDAAFATLLATELQQHPLAVVYPHLFAAAPECVVKWRQRYRGDAAVWKRLFHKDRVMKEFIEAVPVMDAVQRFVSAADMNDYDDNEKKFTIIDLCSGKGFLSMFLSELLPPSKVARLVLMDKAWPMHGTTTLGPQHMSWQHIYGTVPSSSSSSQKKKYIETWPIPLTTSKQDLKHRNQRRKLAQRFLQNNEESSSPVILLGIHLCGTLSMHAIRLFNEHTAVKFFCLKPCCLPGMVHAKRHEVFRVGRHAFDSKLVCVHGKWNKDQWSGPHRSRMAQIFAVWVQNLFWGIGGGNSSTNNYDDNTHPKGNQGSGDHDEELHKKQVHVRVQIDGGYQNEFLFAERLPATEEVWKAFETTSRQTTTARADSHAESVSNSSAQT
eukprot:scaffold24543_cov195-Amphora_coffeaeformis.AAC.3